jgi:hypothetical protein
LIPNRAGGFSLLHSVKTGSGAHPPSCPMDTEGLFAGGKAAGAVKLTTLYVVPKLRMVELYLRHSPYVFMAWCLINEGQGQVFLSSKEIHLHFVYCFVVPFSNNNVLIAK